MAKFDSGEESLDALCAIRHTETNYDYLATFYAVNRELRTRLNQACNAFLKGKKTPEAFKKEVEEIEALVDLTKKENQKRFKKAAEARILGSGTYSKGEAKKLAEEDLAKVLRTHKKHQEINKRLAAKKERGKKR